MTANSLASVSLEPPLVSVCVDHAAELHDLIVAAPEFVVNILESGQEELVAPVRRPARGPVRRASATTSARRARSCSTGRWPTSSASGSPPIPAATIPSSSAGSSAATPSDGPPAALLPRRLRRARHEPRPSRSRSARSAPSCWTIRRPIRPPSPSRCATSRARTAGSAAPRRCGTASPARCAGVPRRHHAHPGGPRHRPGRPAARPRCAGRPGAGVRLVPVGLERSPVAARLARGRRRALRRRPAPGAPPFRDKSVDVVLVSQVAHHLADESAVRLFRACDRLARRAVIVADLRRGPLGPLAFWVGARALGFDRVTVADGMTSLRRGYTPAELRAPARGAPASRAMVERRPGLPAGGHLAAGGRVMRTVDRTRMRAPVDRVLEAAVDVERWPALLPPLPLGAKAGAPRRRRAGGDGGVAAVRSAQVSDLVGLGDVGGPRRAGGALPPRAGNNGGHGRGLADGAGGRRDRSDDRARLDRAALAAHRGRRRRRGSSARCSSMESRRGRWRASGGRWRQERHERRRGGW